MTNYSQRDIRWKFIRLGTGGTNIGGYGCAITCLAMMCGKTPAQVNDILKKNGGYASGNLVIWAKACQLLGLRQGGETPNVAHVRGNGFAMHFVIWLGNNQIIDPWDGRQKTNPYIFVGFKNVTLPLPLAPVQAVAPEYPKLITVKSTVHVRTQPNDNAPLAGSKTLYQGNVFTAVAKVKGENVAGCDDWYKSSKGNYVWSKNC